MFVALIVLALAGGRLLVLMPLISAFVVAARYLSRRAVRRLLVILPVAVLLYSSVVFLTRAEQNQTLGPLQSVLYDPSGERTTIWESSYRSLSLSLGESMRVVSELHERDATSPPFTTTLWFAHNLTPRAIDPHEITVIYGGAWLTSTYAGQPYLDFGVTGTLLFGLVFGAAAHLVYRRFAAGRSTTIIWVYAYLAGPILMSFYVNIFLYFLFPIVDLAAIVVLSRVLIQKPKSVLSPLASPAPVASGTPAPPLSASAASRPT